MSGLRLQVCILGSSSVRDDLYVSYHCLDNILTDAEPVWKQDAYSPFGKWMDGWESRRRRTEGHDWAIIKLGISGIIRAIEIDTAFFTGNFSLKVSINGARSADEGIADNLLGLRAASVIERPEHGRMGLKATEEEWTEVNKLDSHSWPVLVPLAPLGAGYDTTRRTLFHIPASTIQDPIKFLRVNMGPDGGIARIRVYGEVIVHPQSIPFDRDVDLASIENGGMAIGCSNKHYGHPRNLIAPGRGNCMGDGWETARQPKRPAVYEKGSDGLMILPGYDWAVLQLGVNCAIVNQLEIDTHFYAGNYPESCLIEACCLPRNEMAVIDILKSEEHHDETQWQTLLPRTRLGPDRRHFFSGENGLQAIVGVISHIKVTMFPDGGIMRVRVHGRRSANGDSKL